jgi:hypothetical protein
LETAAVKESGIPTDVPEEIRPWAEQLHALATATGLPSQARLATALHLGKATLSRYLSAERLPDRSTVDKLVELAQDNGHAVDEPALFRAYRAADEAFAERRRRGRDNAQVDPPVARRADRRRLLVRSGVAAVVVAAAGVGVVAFSGGFDAPDPRDPVSRADVTCVGSSCAGKNHQGQGCSADAQSLGSEGDGAIVEVMYSRSCQAVWGKAKGLPPGAIVKITGPDGPAHRALEKAESGEDKPKPTLMLPAPAGTRFKACIVIGNEDTCTGLVEIPD